MKLSQILLMVAAFTIGGAACSRKPAQDTPKAEPVDVLVSKAEAKDVPISRDWVASLDGSANVDIRARVQGYLVKQAYKEGTQVKVGDLLFEIDSRPFQAALAQAKADLSKAQANAVNAALEEKRQLQMVKANATSEANRDSAVQASIAAKAVADAAEAAVQQAQLNLEYCRITAPIDGIAGMSNSGIGDLVGPSGVVLTTISTVDPIRASLQLGEQDYMRVAERISEVIKNGIPDNRTPALELVLASGAVYPSKGDFDKINRQVNPKTGTIEIGTLFPNPGNILRPGQFARIRIVTGVRKGAILIPARAVYEMQGTFLAAIVDGAGKAQIRPVAATEQIGSQWVIEKGIQDGDTVIVDGLLKVRSGTPVNAKPWIPSQPKSGTN